jgi:NADPH:quinone reductase-like Zn-dependent oxidoreductase
VVTSDRCMKSSDALSLEEAVTMPTAYATAMYSLIELGSLKKGQVRPARTTR